MKKKFNTLDKVSVVVAFFVLITAIFAFTIDRYYWLINIVFILIALNLIIMGIRSFTTNKRTIFPYFIIGMALLIISLSTKQLLY